MRVGLFDVFDVAGSGMRAQSVRLNVTSSNLANADSVAGSEQAAYHARHPIFETMMLSEDGRSSGVSVQGIIESRAPAVKRYQPDHPAADETGHVYAANVNAIEEMVNMLSASRSYQSNVEVLNTTRDLMLGTLRMGQ